MWWVSISNIEAGHNIILILTASFKPAQLPGEHEQTIVYIIIVESLWMLGCYITCVIAIMDDNENNKTQKL